MEQNLPLAEYKIKFLDPAKTQVTTEIRQISTHPSGACQFILSYANYNDIITSSLLLVVIIWG